MRRLYCQASTATTTQAPLHLHGGDHAIDDVPTVPAMAREGNRFFGDGVLGLLDGATTAVDGGRTGTFASEDEEDDEESEGTLRTLEAGEDDDDDDEDSEARMKLIGGEELEDSETEDDIDDELVDGEQGMPSNPEP